MTSTQWGATVRLPLLGRDDEQRRIATLLHATRSGHGGALLLVGEPGIGKTALLDAATAGQPVLRVDGHEAESTLPFAAIHRLLISLREHLDTIPARQQQALLTATGAADGPPPNRFLVGLGVLGLLSAASATGPVVCVVDDAHLLDPESMDALALVARRLAADSAALILAAREEPALEDRFAGVPLLRLPGLAAEDALQLLKATIREPIDAAAAARIAKATGGNPLALIDLANEFSARELTETSINAEPIPVGRRLEAFYLRQVRRTGSAMQEWLLLAAADPTGNLDMLRAAAERLGLTGIAGDEPELAGLVELGPTVRFRHPLVRSATYGGATGPDQRRVHRALSATADDLDMAELAAWHAAKATMGTDANVADRLERVADEAGRRGGSASRAGVLIRAAALTPQGAVKDRRQVAAAEAALEAGAAALAGSLLHELDGGRLEPVTRGRWVTARVNLTYFTGSPDVVRSPAEMLAAAEAFRGLDPEAERRALIKAFGHAVTTDRLGEAVGIEELGRRLLAGAALGEGTAVPIMRGLGAYVLWPYADAVPLLRTAMTAIGGLEPAGLLLYGQIGVAVAAALWDETAMRDCLRRAEAAARELGSQYALDAVLWTRSLVALRTESPLIAQQYAEQVQQLRHATGHGAGTAVNVALLAWSGNERRRVETLAEQARETGLGAVHASAIGALAVLDLAEGRYSDAYARLKPFVDEPFLQATPLDYPDFIEAAARAGHRGEAASFVAALEELATANGSTWALGVTQRSRALISGDDEAEAQYLAAIVTLTPTTLVIDTGRAHLLYGEWLRRRRRRRDARKHLHRAVEIFDTRGAPAFGRRARMELEAIGERLAAGPVQQAPVLTPQEATVARLAAAGNTNAEIGATMFISANTVDYHLRKVFRKLGVTSRRHLAHRLGN